MTNTIKNMTQLTKKRTYVYMKTNTIKKRRLTKVEWKVISFALSTLEANAGQDLDCYGKDAEKMKEALDSAAIKVAVRS